MVMQARLAESSGVLFTLKSVSWTPETPRKKDPFTIKGKIDLFGIPFLTPVWVIASVTYPKQLTDITGAPVAHEMSLAWGGNFTIKFPEGFDREGSYKLDLSVYLGPTVTTSAGFISSASITVPPFPPVTRLPTQSFTVSGSAPGAGTVTDKVSVVYNNNQTTVNSGKPVTAQITWKNTDTSPHQPKFRLDLKGTGTFDTHLEGSWVTAPSVDPGSTGTVTVTSIPVPADWVSGKQLHAIVILDGVDGDWDTSPLLTVYVPGTVVGAVVKQSVVYNNNQTQVNSGQAVSVQITWKNGGTTSVQPQFRVDLKGTGVFDTHLEGPWVTAPSVAAGATGTVTVTSIPVPSDWQGGKQLYAIVILNGVDGDWDTSPLLTVSGAGGGGGGGGGGTGGIGKQSVVYNNNQTQVNSGQAISVQIAWKNGGTASITPRFRVDIQGSGTFDTPLEGQWVTSPAGAADQVVTLYVSSIPIPTDWQNGKTLHAYVMLEGVNGHWDESSLLVVVKGGSTTPTVTITNPQAVYGAAINYTFAGFQPNAQVYATVQGQGGTVDSPVADSNGAGTSYFYGNLSVGSYVLVVTDGYNHSATASFSIGSQGGGGAAAVNKTSVVYNNNQTNINSGQPIQVKITWYNPSSTPLSPRFRVDIEGTGFFDSPLEGAWVTSPAGSSGKAVTVTASSIPIPTDWQNGKTLHAYVMLEGVNGHWDEASLLFTVVKGGGAAASLSASFSGGVVSYSFAGFQPNAAVALTVTQTGGGLTVNADANGGGTGAFYDSDPAGGYTLRATDNYGHSASASFTITGGGGGGGAPSLIASYSNKVTSYVFSGFQPSATISLVVMQTGGGLDVTADSNGGGNGAFIDNDPPGSYTLKATDGYGHTASSNFTI